MGEIANGVVSYLKRRHVPEAEIEGLRAIAGKRGVLGKMLDANGFAYAIDHYLDSSGRTGYDIQAVNRALGIDSGTLVAVALAEGDDPICIDLKSGHVVLWLVGDGERIQLANTVGEFASMIVRDSN